MKRSDMMDKFEDDDTREEVKEIIDYLEGKFNEIRDLLAAVDISNMDNVAEAYDMAASVSNDIY